LLLRLVLAVVMMFGLLLKGGPIDARSCETLPIPCMYEGMPFTLSGLYARAGESSAMKSHRRQVIDHRSLARKRFLATEHANRGL
jgi:hypothetical protein